MRQILSEFLEGVADRPYRELIQYHIKKQSTAELQQAVLSEVSLLPEELQPVIMDYIDQTNSHLSHDQDFWKIADCRQAFEQIMVIALSFLPIQNRISSIEFAFEPENQQLAFQLFQIPTLTFAYSASTQKAQRKFMGIKKGILG